MSQTYRPHISDHAVLRYMDRVKGVDVESIVAEMDAAGLKASIDFGARAVKIGGVKFLVKGKCVTTVWDENKDGKFHPTSGKAKNRKWNTSRNKGGKKSKRLPNSK